MITGPGPLVSFARLKRQVRRLWIKTLFLANGARCLLVTTHKGDKGEEAVPRGFYATYLIAPFLKKKVVFEYVDTFDSISTLL